MRKYLIFCILIVPLFVACSPETGDLVDPERGEPAVEQDSESETAPLSTVEQESVETAVPIETVVLETREALIEQRATPVVVDIGKLTPPPTLGTEPIEQPAPGVPGTTAQLIEAVKQDLSSKFDVAIDEIEVLAIEEMNWRDSSLGCPQPDMAYLQVITPGFRITLSVDRKIFYYHSRDISHFLLCQNPSQEQVHDPITTPPDQ